jgi:type IV secretory pathway TraG/TraD family ATPase VirD4
VKPNDRSTFIASIQNKLGAFLSNPKLQRVLGDSKAKLNFRNIMDDGKVLIVNLSKGRLGENASDLLGTLLVTSLQLAAMSRANIAEPERRDFSIIIDEFQNAATPSIATFLSEARKYRTHMILANQFTRQIPEEILAAIFGNVGSKIVFQIGANEVEAISKQLASDLFGNELSDIPRYHAYCRKFTNDGSAKTFSMKTTLAA